MDIRDTEAVKDAVSQFDAMRNAVSKLDAFKIASVPMPRVSFPEIRMPKMTTLEEAQNYASSGVLISRLADKIRQWRTKLPKNQQPVVMAVLQNGASVNVLKLSEESYHGILVEGEMGGQPCMILCHQDTLQLLCYVEEVKKEEQRREIGFHVIGKEN